MEESSIQMLFSYLGYATLPIGMLFCYFLIRELRSRSPLVSLTRFVLAFAFMLGAWSFYIERETIVVRRTHIEMGIDQKIVVIADMHAGSWTQRAFIEKVVRRIESLNDIDMVLIAGDFSNVRRADWNNIYAPFSELDLPVYAVFGNHDTARGDQQLVDNLRHALDSNAIEIIEGDVIEFPRFTLVGLGDKFSGRDSLEKLRRQGSGKDVIVLTHNPDTTLDYTPEMHADLTITGHTHCGQIRFPLLKSLALSMVVDGPFDDNLHRIDEGRKMVFVTCGLGTTGVPFRLFNPPVIDVLHL
jgi:predicted MPP superfamily phosphohydrolase